MDEVGETGGEGEPVRARVCGERTGSAAGRFEEPASAVEGLAVSGWLVEGSLVAGTSDSGTEVIVRKNSSLAGGNGRRRNYAVKVMLMVSMIWRKVVWRK